MAKLPDTSVDMIFTDPPYLKDTIHFYGELAQEAKRILKPGGYCFAYCGAQFLPESIPAMSRFLTWFWLFEIRHKCQNPRFWYKKRMVGNKPVLAFTNGKPKRLAWLCTICTSEKKSKDYHEWGQDTGFPQKIITSLTSEGDTILDPFMGGELRAWYAFRRGENL